MSDKACVLCNSFVDDTLQFGEKVTYEDTTAHLYCLLLTSNLVQNGEDDEGISGFMPKDIKAEVTRTKKLLCYYCHEKGATIGCCLKSCRRSFHLPCALENDCRLEFTNTFRSFCDAHHDIKTPKHVHKATDSCTICFDEMGKYNVIRSIPLPCCNKNAWCHKLCLQKYAQTSGYFLRCPLCKDSDNFRNWIAERGVFIPDRDAKWEIDENGTNSFYGFEQHSERPSECEAKLCKCKKGRKYRVDIENNRYSLVYCDYCGSHAAHHGCITGEDFLCEECTAIVNQSRANGVNTLSIQRNDVANIHGHLMQPSQSVAGGSGSRITAIMRISTDDQFDGYLQSYKHLISKYELRDFSIRLRRLTAKDLGFTLEPSDSDTVNKSQGTSDSSDGQTDSSSSDENVNKTVIPNNKRAINISSTDSEYSDNQNKVKPAKRTRLLPRDQFFDSDSDEMDTKVDINDNSKNMQFSSAAASRPSKTDFLFEQSRLHKQTSLRVRQFSTSQEDQIRLTGANNCKPNISESSDDQNFGKENEKPLKSVAVVRPFSRNETSLDESVKPIKSRARPRQQLSSSDETNEEFPIEGQLFKKSKHETTGMEKEVNSDRFSIQPEMDIVKYNSPSKKKRRTLASFFRNSTSSDEEQIEVKPKRKSPKFKQRPIPPNQSTIMDFFKKKFNQNT